MLLTWFPIICYPAQQHRHTSVWLSHHTEGESEITLLLQLLLPWQQYMKASKWMMSGVTVHPQNRSWPSVKPWESCVGEGCENRFCSVRGPRCVFTTSTGGQLGEHHFLRHLHLKLESSCSWIILSWDGFLEYLRQNYPEGMEQAVVLGVDCTYCKQLLWTVMTRNTDESKWGQRS